MFSKIPPFCYMFSGFPARISDMRNRFSALSLVSFTRDFFEENAQFLYAKITLLTIGKCDFFDMSSLHSEKEIIVLADCPNTHLQYVVQQREQGNEVVFWLKIKQEVLARWRKEKSSNKFAAGVLYIDLVNLIIPGNAFYLNRNSERLETQLSNSCIVADATRRKINKKGSAKQRKEFLDSYKKLAVLKNDIISVEKFKSEISNLEQNVNTAEAEIKLWKQKYLDLEKEKEDLLQEMLREKEMSNSCKEESELMKKYIKQLEKDQFTKVRGIAVPKLKTTQAQKRKLKEIKTRAQKALHFSKLFGLELNCLRLKDPDSSKMYTVDFHTENSPECGPLPDVSKDNTFPDTPPDGQALPNTPPGGLQPDTSPGGLQPDTPPGGLQPDTSPGGLRPDTPPGGLQPDTPPGGLQPDTPPGGLQPDTPPGGLRPDTPPGGLLLDTPPSSFNTLQTPSANKQSHLSNQTSCQSETQYSKLSDDDKAKVEGILYLIDKFGVGDEFMHELSMVVDGLPKSYLFKQCRTDLNMGCIITSTPGRAPGAQYSFKQLLADRVKHMVSTSGTEQVIFCRVYFVSLLTY